MCRFKICCLGDVKFHHSKDMLARTRGEMASSSRPVGEISDVMEVGIDSLAY